MTLSSDRYVRLTAEVAAHNQVSYKQDAPTLSNAEYDALVRELWALGAQFPKWVTSASPAQTVGGQPSTLVEKIRHSTPMTSLDNAFTDEALAHFGDKVARALNLPLGSQSFNLYSVGGVLQWAATRGGGETGEKVTVNIADIPGIPARLEGLSGELEVRGEVYMSRAAFLAYNTRAEGERRALLKNSRDGAANALRPKDPDENPATRAERPPVQPGQTRRGTRPQ